MSGRRARTYMRQPTCFFSPRSVIITVTSGKRRERGDLFMPRARKTRMNDTTEVQDYRHDAKRKNNPPVGMVTYEPQVKEVRKQAYAYDPHLSPQLVWAGKAGLKQIEVEEQVSCEVDTVSLHIHERVSTSAIVRAVKRPEPKQFSLFSAPELPLHEAVEFYQHEMDWTNRLILGDSLLVMNSLLQKELMAGKVQMIYVDPPYGVKFSSNFQLRIDQRDVKDGDEHLTREPEQIKAYRDTWTLGIHSYLTYLRDRLILCRELLHESGSIFVQISDENLHRVRLLMDEVFGAGNFVAQIVFAKTTSATSKTISSVYDTLLWYAKDREQVKYRQLYRQKVLGEEGTTQYVWIESSDGSVERRMTTEEVANPEQIESGWKIFACDNLTSQRPAQGADVRLYNFRGKDYSPGKGTFKTDKTGLDNLAKANRLKPIGNSLMYKRYLADFMFSPIANVWTDTKMTGFTDDKLYVVQTGVSVIQRCLLMTTDPGDLVFDPTCVRKGTRVLTPLNPPVNGGTCATPSPLTGRAGVGLLPIETIQPGDMVVGHDGKPHRVLRTIRKPYQGTMVGIQHSGSPQILWVTADHRILCQRRTQSYGAEHSWRHVPQEHFERARTLRKEMTEAERRLWHRLRGEQLGAKFRKQHPIGPYIVDFYSWRAGLVIEVDGDTHFTPEAQAYDRERDAYLQSLGLTVLRFPNREVFTNLEGVLEAITTVLDQAEPSEDHDREWRRADSLREGDVVFWCPPQSPQCRRPPLNPPRQRGGNQAVSLPENSGLTCSANAPRQRGGVNLQPVRVTRLFCERTQEDVYDLEVEGAHSFLTEVCAVHNCGSGTTAYCAEKWGRRWITCDISRVALSLARQRLMTAKYDYYELSDPERGVSGGFVYKTVPHITLKSIANNEPPETETLYDQPEIERGKVRVSGPFTVEAIPPAYVEENGETTKRQNGESEEPSRDPVGVDVSIVPTDSHIPTLIELLRKDGVTFPNNRKMTFATLTPRSGGVLHAEGEREGESPDEPAGSAGASPSQRVAVSFGPLYGQVTARQVEDGIREANLGGFDAVVFCGFAFDGAAQAAIDRNVHPRVKAFMAHIRPDVLMQVEEAEGKVNLLKTTANSQLFTVFGEPDVDVRRDDDQFIITLRGVDIYNPLTGEVHSDHADKIAAWFIDTDYDGRTFCICQAFFPDKSAWDKLQRALRGSIDDEAFEKLTGKESLPFPAGEYKRAAVKVIDHRGNEVMKVVELRDARAAKS